MKRSALLAVLLVVSCKRSPPAPEAPVAHDVHCVAAVELAVADEIELRGVVAARPDRDAVVAAEVAGRIKSIAVREGDAVKQGAVVAEIECGTHVDALRQAQAAADAANAALVEASSAREREAHLVDRGIAARQSLDTAVAREATAKATVTSSRAQLDDARLIVGRCTVRAGQDGVVLALHRRTGDIVDGTSATAIAEIADPSAAEITVGASAADLARLHVDQRASVSYGGSDAAMLAGHVVAAPPIVDRASGLGAVRIALEPGAARPVIGAHVTVTIDLGSTRTAVAVPRAAVRSAGGEKSEVVLCGKPEAHVVEVQVGGRSGDHVQVSGLAVGDRVVADGALGIDEGTPIHEVVN